MSRTKADQKLLGTIPPCLCVELTHHITVSGAMKKDSLEAGLGWMGEVVEANDGSSIRVDMAKGDVRAI